MSDSNQNKEITPTPVAETSAIKVHGAEHISPELFHWGYVLSAVLILVAVIALFLIKGPSRHDAIVDQEESHKKKQKKDNK